MCVSFFFACFLFFFLSTHNKHTHVINTIKDIQGLAVKTNPAGNNYTAGAKSFRPVCPWKLRASAQARMRRTPVGRPVGTTLQCRASFQQSPAAGCSRPQTEETTPRELLGFDNYKDILGWGKYMRKQITDTMPGRHYRLSHIPPRPGMTTKQVHSRVPKTKKKKEKKDN